MGGYFIKTPAGPRGPFPQETLFRLAASGRLSWTLHVTDAASGERVTIQEIATRRAPPPPAAAMPAAPAPSIEPVVPEAPDAPVVSAAPPRRPRVARALRTASSRRRVAAAAPAAAPGAPGEDGALPRRAARRARQGSQAVIMAVVVGVLALACGILPFVLERPPHDAILGDWKLDVDALRQEAELRAQALAAAAGQPASAVPATLVNPANAIAGSLGALGALDVALRLRIDSEHVVLSIEMPEALAKALPAGASPPSKVGSYTFEPRPDGSFVLSVANADGSTDRLIAKSYGSTQLELTDLASQQTMPFRRVD